MAINSIYKYPPGSLVNFRGRDWLVLPEDEEDVLRLRPIDGLDHESIGLYMPLEGSSVKTTSYAPPSAEKAGDFTGGMLLRDAARMNLRSGAGPFRSLGRVSVVPRPYQFVPLLMALKLDPVRLLIADDVGVGKTVEALMIAREMLDRGEIKSVGILCPPHLCRQWADEMRDKFNIDAAVIQPSRLRKLERAVPRADMPIYEYYRHFVASIDFVKLDNHKHQLLQNMPDLLIVDEAHSASRPPGTKGRSQQRRYELISEISKNSDTHILLVTATPHSGIEESYRSLLGVLDPKFDREGIIQRRTLVPFVVQRRRVELESWMGSETNFPNRESDEISYQLSESYSKLFEAVLSYCRETISRTSGRSQRVRYWAAISILRCLMSSPGAAEAMLEARQGRVGSTEEIVETEANEDIDGTFRLQILDSSDTDEAPDYVPTGAIDDETSGYTDRELQALNGFLRQAKSLSGPTKDAKLAALIIRIDQLLSDGYRPIIYCRFIATARYLEQQLPEALSGSHSKLRVKSVTGDDGGAEQREEIIKELSEDPVRVLVATDCLSEGINLQHSFDSVVHYDLPWNPNRLEQREGRVDRFGQPAPTVKTSLIYGANNQIDLTVLNVLIRKAATIRRSLGVSVPVPDASEQIMEALIESVLLSGQSSGQQLQMSFELPEVSEFHSEWDAAAEREAENRSFFSQSSIDPKSVAQELEEMNPVLGESDDIRRFVANALQRFDGDLRPAGPDGVYELRAGDMERRFHDLWSDVPKFPIRVSFSDHAPEGTHALVRNHPVVTGLAEECFARALSQTDSSKFNRSSAVFTDLVDRRTGIAILRLRYLLKESAEQFAEEIITVAFCEADDGNLEWIDSVGDHALHLLANAVPTRNIHPTERSDQVKWAIELVSSGNQHFDNVVEHRVNGLVESHQRIRDVTRQDSLIVEPHLPPDLLGCYVLIPSGGG
jgi:superfamily II DNA or RNA helicase